MPRRIFWYPPTRHCVDATPFQVTKQKLPRTSLSQDTRCIRSIRLMGKGRSLLSVNAHVPLRSSSPLRPFCPPTHPPSTGSNGCIGNIRREYDGPVCPWIAYAINPPVPVLLTNATALSLSLIRHGSFHVQPFLVLELSGLCQRSGDGDGSADSWQQWQPRGGSNSQRR